MTIEELQDENIKLKSQISELTNEVENGKIKLTSVEKDLQSSRDMNQKLYLKITESEPSSKQSNEDPVKSLDELAKEYNFRR